MTHSSLITQLRERELIAQVSHEAELISLLQNLPSNQIPLAVYCGFDPTAPSLHLGHLTAITLLQKARQAGLQPIILFGGATGLIGDPTGRTEMRPMHSKEDLACYVNNFKKLLTQYFPKNGQLEPIFLNNLDWIGSLSWLDFSTQIGRHFTVARLLSAEVNKTRFQEGGLTFMELGYQLLQSYDFLHLYRNYHCVLQIGGDDQWSNILSGADLIRRLDKGLAFALTTPLLVSSDGKKFGKTAGNALWLDPKLTSPYTFFQFLRNLPDGDTEKMLNIFTDFPLNDIKKQCAHKNPNIPKEFMAFELTKKVHGEAAAKQARQASTQLFAIPEASSPAGEVPGAPTTVVSASELAAGLDILALVVKTHLCRSRGEARKLIQGNGLNMNGVQVTDPFYKIQQHDFQAPHETLLLRKGKKDYHLVKCEK